MKELRGRGRRVGGTGGGGRRREEAQREGEEASGQFALVRNF